MIRGAFVALVPGVAALALPRPARAADMPADAIFASAKNVWRARTEAPFVTFNLRERYVWRARTHDNWWAASYRDGDGALALRRSIVAEDEAQRLRGSAIALNFRWHHGVGRADSIDTNGDADAFPVLDPLIDPNASFGLLHREQTATLVGNVSPTPDGPDRERPRAIPTVTPLADASPSPGDAPLRQLANVDAVARDYAIRLVGTESVRGVDAYHLTLTPVRSPMVNRLRDLWIDASTFETLRLVTHGLFRGKPYEDARWTVTYVKLAGRNYVQQVRTDETLRFGLDRFVPGLQYDFVGYDFPASISPLTFERLL